MLGSKIPDGQARDSRNHLETLLGGDAKGAEVILESSFQRVAIRRDHWKYIGDTAQLYDLSGDPGETDNLAGRHPEIAAQMKELLGKHVGK